MYETLHSTGNQIYHSIVDHATEAILLFDHELHVSDANPRALEILGYSREQLYGKSLLELVTDQSRDEIEQLLSENSSRRCAYTEVHLRHGNGETVTVDIHLSRLNGNVVVFCRDVGRRRVLEEEVRNLACAVRATADAVFITDTQGMIYFVNPAFQNLTGYSSAEALGKTARILKSGRVPREVYEDMWNCILGGREWRGELTNRRKNGDIYEADVTVTPIKDNNHKVISFLSVQRDITHRKRLERQLEEYTETLEKRVRAQTEALSKLHEISELLHSLTSLDEVLQTILIAVTAGDGFRFNRAFVLLMDEAGETMNGNLAIGPSTPEEAGHIWHRLAYLPKRHRLAETLESYLRCSEGEDLEVNRIVRQLKVSIDDDSSILTRAIREKRGFNVINGHAEEFGEIVMSKYPAKTGKFVQVEPPGPRLCDVSLSKYLGTNTFAVVPLLWREDPVGCLIVDNLINREPITEADLWVLELFAGQAALAIVHTRLLDRLERDKHQIESAYRDLTESQAKLVEAETMAGLGRMAATVAHEIRTPIVAIGGFARRLTQDLRDSRAQRMLDIIRSEAMRLEETLDTILFYVKPSLPQKKENDLNELLETLSLYFAQETTQEDIQVEFQLDESLPLVPFDERQMRQVILNILQNAVQAIEDGGTIAVRTRQEENFAIMSIEDTGCGIEQEDLQNIFKEFFTKKNKGTGLGLHVSSRIVENHGGCIEVTSKPGEGTTVQVRLPLTRDIPDRGTLEENSELGIVEGRR